LQRWPTAEQSTLPPDVPPDVAPPAWQVAGSGLHDRSVSESIVIPSLQIVTKSITPAHTQVSPWYWTPPFSAHRSSPPVG
jgi:hypothetical protein